MSKQTFIQQVAARSTELAQLQEIISGMAGVYTARGYQSGGSDQISDLDLSNAGISLTSAQFSAAVTVLGDFLNFCNNGAVTARDRKTDLNRARNDI